MGKTVITWLGGFRLFYPVRGRLGLWLTDMLCNCWVYEANRPIFMPMTYRFIPETDTKLWYQFSVRESGTGFWYQLQLEAKFLVSETNMADDADEIGAVCAMAVIVIKQRENRTWLHHFLFLPRSLTAPPNFQPPLLHFPLRS